MSLSTLLIKNIRLQPVIVTHETNIEQELRYYMGKNSQERQDDIIENLVVEKEEAPIEL